MVLECINCCNRFHTKHINGISRRKLFIKYFEGKVKNYLWNECCQYHFIDPGNFCDNIIEERYKYCLTHKSVLLNTPELILQDKYADFFKNITYSIEESELLEQWSQDFLLEYSYKDSHDKLLICVNKSIFSISYLFYICMKILFVISRLERRHTHHPFLLSFLEK